MKSGLLIRSSLFALILPSLLLLSLTSPGCGNNKDSNKQATEPTNISSPDSFSRSLGLDVLALQHPLFDYQALINVTPKKYSIGFLDFTFGTSLKSVETVLILIEPAYLRVHLLNGSCLFNENCGSYSPLENYTSASFEDAILSGAAPEIISHIKNRSVAYCSLSKQFPKTKLLISPMLEHRLKQEAWEVLADAVLQVCPGVQLVNNWHDGLGERYKGALVELHGEVGTGFSEEINSLDGDDIFKVNVEDWLERTKYNLVTFAWTERFNCRVPGDFIDPRHRTFCPEEEIFRHVVELLSES